MVVMNHHGFILNPTEGFEQLYNDLRFSERRIYSDGQVSNLPDIDDGNLYKREWEARKASSERLKQYLDNKKKPLKILEIGCGNGWLSHRLSQIRSSYVIGLDINLLELKQAERVFKRIPNLAFVYGDVDSASLEKQRFDIVVFAAAIQYFENLPAIIRKVMERLNDDGEIHLVDSHFYPEEEVKEARRRSEHYFHKQGFDRMTEFYFHHSIKELSDFRYTILYNPNSIVNKLFRTKSRFHWICIN